MKKNLTLLLSLFITISVLSQDLIVTTSLDSINCRIIRVTSDKIYYHYKRSDVLLPLSDVRDFRYQFYNSQNALGNSERFEIQFSGGYSRLTAKLNEKIDNSLRPYYKDLQNSYHYAIKLKYYTKKHFGFGFLFNQFSTKNTIEDVVFVDTNQVAKIGTLSDDIKHYFIGFEFSKRLVMTNYLSFEPFTSFNYVIYKNNLQMINKYLFRGATSGLVLGTKFNISIVESLKMDIGFSYRLASIKTFSVSLEDGTEDKYVLPEDQYEGLHRFDVFMGLCYAF